MNILKELEQFEKESMERARNENPLRLGPTPVSKVIDTVPQELFQESYEREQQAGYVFNGCTPVKPFEFKGQKLFCFGNVFANFYYEINNVTIMLGNEADESYNGYSMTVTIHVFRNGKETTQRFTGISKEQLESPGLLEKIPFALTEQNVMKGDLKSALYSYVKYLLSQYNGETEYVVRYSGWKKLNGKWMYIDAEKAIGFPDVKIHSMGNLRIHNIREIKNLWEQYQKMRGVLKDSSMMDALLIHVLSSYIFTLFREAKRTIKHCMVIQGARGTRKTALALCFSQVENKETPQITFQATESGIQSVFRDYQDACLLIDDLAPSTNPAKKRAMEDKLEMIIRLFGDAGKRVINTYFATPKAQGLDYTVKGGALITGEYFYSAGVESSIARTIVLQLEKDSVNLDQLTYFQQHPEILETLLYRFLNYIAKNWDASSDLISQTVDEYRMRCQGQFSNDRYADYFGQHMAVSHLLANFFCYESGIGKEQKVNLCREHEEGMRYLLTINDRRMINRAPVNTLLMSIVYMHEIGQSISWGEPLPLENACVIVTDSAFYVRQKDLPDILRTYCAKTGEPYVQMSSQELGKLLCQADICTIHQEGTTKRIAKKYTKDYGNIRLMELPKAAITSKVGALIDEGEVSQIAF